MDTDKQLVANKLTSILAKLPTADAMSMAAFMEGLSTSLHTARARIRTLSGDTAEVRLLVEVEPHDGYELSIRVALADKDRLWKFLEGCQNVVRAAEFVPDDAEPKPVEVG